MSHSARRLIGYTIPVAAVLLLITAAPAVTAAEKPPGDVIQYNANARSYVYGPCAYDLTALGATAFQTTGGTDIYYAEVHSYDMCTGANGYVVREGRTADGKVKIPKNLAKASVTGLVSMSDGSTVAIDHDFTATGPAVLSGYSSGSLYVDLRTRPATVTPGTWTGVVSILESVVHPLTP